MKKLLLTLIFYLSIVFPAWALTIGSEAYLHAEVPYPHIAVDEKALDSYIKALVSGDSPYGVTDLYAKRKLFQVNNDAKVRIIDLRIGKVQIRFLDGDATGRSGWVIPEWITTEVPKSRRIIPRSTISNQYPAKIPNGYTKQIKYKYRLIENLQDDHYTIYDTNKFEMVGGGSIKIYPPIFMQEWHREAFYDEKKYKQKWVKKMTNEIQETLKLPSECFSIIER